MSNSKPFNIERWKAGDKVQYRDGKEVLILHSFVHPLNTSDYPLSALSSDGSFTSHQIDGSFSYFANKHPRDLVMAPKKVTYYFATWRERDLEYRYSSVMHPSLDFIKDKYAEKGGTKDYQIHSIEIEE